MHVALFGLCFMSVVCMLTAAGIFVFLERFARAEVLARRLHLDAGFQPAGRKKGLRRRDLMSEIPTLDSILKKISPARRLGQLCDQAGIRRTVGQVILTSALIMAVVAAGGLDLRLPPAAVLILAGLGALAPFAVIQAMSRKRRRIFVEQLPDVLGVTASSLLAGHGLASALQTVAREMPEPAAGEFSRVSGELALGATLEDALKGLARRMPLADVRFFVAAVLLQVQVGGNLAELLRNLEKTIRARFSMMGELHALTTQGRMSGWILGSLPVAVGFLFWMLNPEYLAILFDDPLGRMMVAVGVGLQMAGLLVIRRMVSIKL